MNRTGRSVLALTIGFTAAGAAIVAATTDGDGRPDPIAEIGEVDVFAHCQERFGAQSQAMLVGTDAFSWRCTNEANGLFQLEDVDLDAACAQRHGEGVVATTDDPDDPYSWVCVK
ncbi:MAG: hypothetical protein AAGF73_06865 [Actinomycetota bacterium]